MDEVSYVVGNSGRHEYSSIVDGPADKQLISDSIFTIDTGSTLDGYFADFNRNWAVGQDLLSGI